MYRVMAVDDEQPVLDSFTHVLNNYSSDFELAAACISGEQALAEVGSTRPDVIFMDVNMPGMDGIEVIRHIRELYPDTLFVLATAYERFDIARKVIPLNVMSYLVKPITRPKLLSELDRAAQILRRKSASSAANSASPCIDQAAIEQLAVQLINGSADGEQWKLFQSSCGFTGHRAALAIVSTSDDSSESQLKLEQMRSTLEYKLRCYCLHIDGHIAVFLDDSPENRHGDGTSRIAEFCPDGLVLHESSLKHSEDFPAVYRLLQEKAGIRPDPAGSETAYLHIRAEQILSSPPEVRDSLIRRFTDTLISSYEFHTARSMIIVLFSFCISESGASSRMMPLTGFSPASELSQIQNEGQWNTWLERNMHRLIHLFGAQEKQALPRSMEQALQYIHDNFSNAMQLSEVADFCRLSTGHLSRLFPKHMGCGFIEYLNTYRVERAEDLIRNNGFSIKEAAFKVGFQDPNYFSRLFKKIRGFVPSELE